MKHAYLIIAHNEFEVLQKLLLALDDERNDIYVHIDKKVKLIPNLYTNKSNLIVLDNRVDVRWGHISQIEAEYLLFEEAFKSEQNYSRFHLISGTHLPLKSQDKIHSFFDKQAEKEILSFLYTNSYEVNMKLGRYHFFLRHYRFGTEIQRRLSQLLWHILLQLQYMLHIQKKNIPNATIKANNWVSLTRGAVGYIISQKDIILRTFRRSFCGDEYFVPYLLVNSGNGFKIINSDILLYNDFQTDSNPRILTGNDYDFLVHSDYLFARKFSKSDIDVVDKIVEHVISMKR
jgi:hypothetical protein